MLFPREFTLLVSWIWSFLKDWWWLVSPPVFLFLLRDFWLFYLRWRRFLAMEFIVLEIRLPQIVERTPQAMEQVFSGLHGIFSKVKPHEKYLHGKVPDWVSCEIVSLNGESHFFIRLPAQFRNLVESHVWAQYPDAEIHEAEDYTQTVPRGIPNANWEMWGAELVLARPDPYPIRTYVEFESPVEERRLDPLAAVLEVMGSIGPGEQIWLQILAEPVFDNWREQGQAIVDKIAGRVTKKKSKGVFGEFASVFLQEIGNVFAEVFRVFGVLIGVNSAPTEQKTQQREPLPSLMMHLTNVEKEILEAIEKNTAKLGFRTGIRMMYLARRESFNKVVPASIFGAIRQFNTQHLNSFIPNAKSMPNVTYLFPKQRNFSRKRKLDWRYRLRFHPRRRFVFNTEELATIFHFPGMMVAKAPSVSRIEAKRGEPPQTLPTA